MNQKSEAIAGTVEDRLQQEIRRLYRSFNRRDIDAVLDRLADDVVWENGMEGGHLHGRRAVRDYWKRQFETIHSQVEPEEIRRTDDGRVAVGVHQVVRSPDGELLADQRVTHIFSFDHTRITRFDIAQ